MGGDAKRLARNSDLEYLDLGDRNAVSPFFIAAKVQKHIGLWQGVLT
jgi:hypothetical protein